MESQGVFSLWIQRYSIATAIYHDNICIFVRYRRSWPGELHSVCKTGYANASIQSSISAGQGFRSWHRVGQMNVYDSFTCLYRIVNLNRPCYPISIWNFRLLLPMITNTVCFVDVDFPYLSNLVLPSSHLPMLFHAHRTHPKQPHRSVVLTRAP